MKNRKFRFELNTILLTIYITFVWSAYLCVYHVNDMEKLLFFTFLGAIPIFFLARFALQKLAAFMPRIPQEMTAKERRKAFAIFFAFAFLVMLVWYIAFYPGAWQWDANVQFGQVMNNDFSDWHPAWHTFLLFALPYYLTGNVMVGVAVQCILFSLLVGYLCMVIAKHAGWRPAILAAAYILLNPFVCKLVLFPVKDAAFAIASAFAYGMVFDNVFSDGKYAKRLWWCLCLGFAIANATIFRHNGILFTGVLLVAIFFWMHWKQWLKVLLSFLVTMVLIEGVLYSAMDVSKAESRVVEASGLPLTILANVIKECPWYDQLDGETYEFAMRMADQEVWAVGTCGNFNSIKWIDGMDLGPVEEEGVLGMLKISLSCLRHSTFDSLKAAETLTDMVYGLEEFSTGDGSDCFIAGNNFGIYYQGNETLRNALETYDSITKSFLLRFWRTYGTALLVCIAGVLAKMHWKSREDWKRLLLCLPFFAYDFGTMLLLTGVTDLRFFMVTYPVAPMVLIVALWRRNGQNR